MNAEHEHVTVKLPPPLLHPFYCRHMASNPSSEKLWIGHKKKEKEEKPCGPTAFEISFCRNTWMWQSFLSLETFLLPSKSNMDTETSYSMLAYINSTFKADSIGK